MKTFFVDTNFLIQCRPPQELDWSLVGVEPGEDILIVVPRVVVREIDHFKGGGNERRASRARQISTLLDQTIGGDGRVIVRPSGPTIALAIAPSVDPHTVPRPANLLDTRADDNLVYELLAYNQDNKYGQACLLTGDTLLKLNANEHGMPFLAIPDAWRLPREPNELQRENERLKREIEALKAQHPNCTIKLVDAQHKPIERIAVQVRAFRPLAAEELEAIERSIQRRFPKTVDFTQPPALAGLGLVAHAYRQPSASEIKDYEKSYEKWLTEVRETLTQQSKKLARRSSQFVVQFELTNDGTCPADNLVIEFLARGSLQFAASNGSQAQLSVEHEAPQFELPVAPEPPHQWSPMHALLQRNRFAEPGFVNSVLSGSIKKVASHNGQRQRRRFYPRYLPEDFPRDSVVFECEEFEHRLDAQILSPVIEPKGDGTEIRGAIECRISASNMRDPLVVTARVDVSFEIVESVTVLRKAIVWAKD